MCTELSGEDLLEYTKSNIEVIQTRRPTSPDGNNQTEEGVLSRVLISTVIFTFKEKSFLEM